MTPYRSNIMLFLIVPPYNREGQKQRSAFQRRPFLFCLGLPPILLACGGIGCHCRCWAIWPIVKTVQPSEVSGN